MVFVLDEGNSNMLNGWCSHQGLNLGFFLTMEVFYH